MVQNILTPDWYKSAAYMWAKMTDPQRDELPLYMHWYFFISSDVIMYFHISGIILQTGG